MIIPTSSTVTIITTIITLPFFQKKACLSNLRYLRFDWMSFCPKGGSKRNQPSAPLTQSAGHVHRAWFRVVINPLVLTPQNQVSQASLEAPDGSNS